MTKKDYYDILEVKKTDSIETIKKNYKKLALKFHPDKATNDKERKEFEEKFKEINEAYTTIGDEEKRKRYDMGETNRFQEGTSSHRGGFADIFENLFGGNPFGGQSYDDDEIDRDLHFRLKIKLTEAVFGCEKEISIKKDIRCESCDGTGSDDKNFETCPKCNGHGKLEANQKTPWGVIRRVIKCDNCNGEGKVPKKKCKKCHGEGIVNSKEKVKIKIPKGIDNGQTLRVPNAGNASKNGRNGDLFLTIQVEPHKIFRRERFNVRMNLDITFSQAALGCELSIPTLTDAIKIKIAKGIESGTTLRLKGKGIPFLDDPRYLGDQLVDITVKTPKRLTKAQSKLFEELRKLDK